MKPTWKSVVATGIGVILGVVLDLPFWPFLLVFLPGMVAGWYARDDGTYFSSSRRI